MYNNLNQKLSDMRSGNYLIKVKSIGDKRPNKFYSKEYFVTVKYQVTDLNNPKRKYGVIVLVWVAKPIELNVDRELFLQTILYGKILMRNYLKDYLELKRVLMRKVIIQKIEIQEGW